MADTESSEQKNNNAPADTKPAETPLKEIEVEGYKFKVNTDLLDDVEAFAHIDRVEDKGQVTALVPLMEFLVGKQGFADMKAHFVKADGKFRMSKLIKVYEAVIAEFDPKG